MPPTLAPDAGWYYRVYIDPTGFGHAFVGIYGPNGESQVSGYYPDVWDPSASGSSGTTQIIQGPGEVRNDAATGGVDPATGVPQIHPYDPTLSTGYIPITEQQAQKMLEYRGWVKANPGEYGAFGNNCVEFVEDMLMVGGVRFKWPDTVFPVHLAYIPHIGGRI